MKVTLDLDHLLAEGRIDQAEYDKFKGFASVATIGLGINLLLGFGVVAMAAALLFLFPTPEMAMVLGTILGLAGLIAIKLSERHWRPLAETALIVGALLFAGGLVVQQNASTASFAIVTVVTAIAGIVATSSLLTVLSVLSLSCMIGTRTDYGHAMYMLSIQEPLKTVGLFAILALVFYQASLRLPHDSARLAIAAARTSIFLVNLGFWVGSLWGDPTRLPGVPSVADWGFSIGWALALLGAGIWAVMVNRRWLVTIAAVFAGIHFYTQLFERLSLTPFSLLVAGVVTVAAALALREMNRRRQETA